MPILRRLWFLLRRSRLDEQLRNEVESHIEQRTREFLEQGLDGVAARQAALRAFGNVGLAREESRDAWGFVWLDLLVQDILHATRALARQPILTSIAVLSLGAAMAAASAVFSLADATVLAGLPVPDPSRLVLLKWVSGPTTPYDTLDGWSTGDDRENSSTSFSYDAFRAAAAALDGRADVFGFADLYQLHVWADGYSDVAAGQLVSGNYFAALGLRPAAGRFLSPSDDRIDAAEPAAVISYAFWQRRFGGRPDAVGATIRVNQVPAVIVGVTPIGFDGTRQVGETADVSVPIALRERFVHAAASGPGQVSDDQERPFDPRYWWVNVMARLAPGVEPERIADTVNAAIRPTVLAVRAASAANEPFRVAVNPGRRGLTEQREMLVQPLVIMSAIVALVILIACANLATLLLARGAGRDREVAVRHALGASRARLVRASMIESLLIGLAGGLVGLLGARWVAQGLAPALDLPPDAVDLSLSVSVVAFAFLAAIVTAVLFGLVPAWRGSDARSIGAIKQGTGRLTASVPRLRAARAILVLQIAMSLVVLVAASLLVGTLRNLGRVEPGFDATHLLVFRIDPSLNGYDQERRRAVLAEILGRLRTLPGVEAASFSQHALLSRSSSNSTVASVDDGKPSSPLMATRLIVDPQFFRTMRIPVIAGTTFERVYPSATVRPVVVNRPFAERAFHTPTPIGHRFRFSDRRDRPTYEVVGVAADVRVVSIRQDVPPTVYFSYEQEPIDRVSFALRVAGDPAALVPAVRRAVAAVDPDLPISRIRTVDDLLAEGVARERLFARLASALGLLALFLACIGVYGVIAYAVSRRTTEIGVRLALGARPRRILLMVIGEAARVVIAGLVLGIAGGFLATRSLASLLFGLTPNDPVMQASAAGLLVVVAVAAALIPARRAAHTDPLAALRHE